MHREGQRRVVAGRGLVTSGEQLLTEAATMKRAAEVLREEARKERGGNGNASGDNTIGGRSRIVELEDDEKIEAP
jgi:hypothetical protein